MSDIPELDIVQAMEKFTEGGEPIPIERTEDGAVVGEILSVERGDDGTPVALVIQEF